MRPRPRRPSTASPRLRRAPASRRSRSTLGASLAGAGEQFGRIARRFDLAIVGQAEPDISAVEEVIAESALFGSGRPIVVVPYIQKGPLKLDNVMVCWDGSRQAARAIADAMPLLEKAGRVEIVIVTNERGKEDEIEGADMGQHLAGTGSRSRSTALPAAISTSPTRCSRTPPIQAPISSSWAASAIPACASSCSGGVTHSILRSMTVRY